MKPSQITELKTMVTQMLNKKEAIKD